MRLSPSRDRPAIALSATRTAIRQHALRPIREEAYNGTTQRLLEVGKRRPGSVSQAGYREPILRGGGALVREGPGVCAHRDNISATELDGRDRLGMRGDRVSGWIS